MSFITVIFMSVLNFIINAVCKTYRFMYVILWGLWNFFRLIWGGIVCLFGKGSLKERLGDYFLKPPMMRAILAVFRAFMPTLVIGKKFVTTVENTGTALVTAYDDVIEVVYQDKIFHSTYTKKLEMLTGGYNFFLSMQDSPEYVNNVSAMRLVVNLDDISTIVAPFISQAAEAAVARSNGTMDIPQDMTLPALEGLVGAYYGTPGPEQGQMTQWMHDIFRYIFFDFTDTPEIVETARKAGLECRIYLDDLITARAASGEEKDDVIGRCLKLQEGGSPAMDNLAIRNNMVGMLTPVMPNISSETVRVLNQMFEKPKALEMAVGAVKAGDDALLDRIINECFRFDPMNPVIYRLAMEDYVLGRGTIRERKIPKGTFVFAANLSAMFDPWKFKSPGRFDIDRPDSNYILFGLGLHHCFGTRMSQVAVREFLKPLLRCKNLRRAPGNAGQINNDGTPFPLHLRVEFSS